MRSFDQSMLHDFETASRFEWIETDGRGGMGASTILAAHTRKQHGLFSINDDHDGRIVLLSNLQETVECGHEAYDLSTIVYRGAVDPAAYRHLTHFSSVPWPTWRFAFDDFEIERQYFVVQEEHHTAVVVYSLVRGHRPVTLTVRPLLAFRDQNGLRHETHGLPANWHVNDEFAECQPFEGGPTLFIAHPFAERQTVPLWYREFYYTRDAEQGLDCVEDLFHPGLFRIQLPPRQLRALVFSSPSPRSVSQVPRYMEIERRRRSETRHAVEAPRDAFFQTLLASADAFVYERHDGVPGIFEGLPWNRERMKPTLMALPGLLLVPRRFEESACYLEALAAQLADHAALRERRDRSTDALLWAFVAGWRHWKATGDVAFVQSVLVPLLTGIAESLQRSVSAGLLPSSARGKKEVPGFSVEINALWHNAQMVLAELLAAAGNAGDGADWQHRAELTKREVNARFACRHRAGLAHWIQDSPGGLDETLSASQILAAGLPFPVANDLKGVVDIVREHLATPYGLRTLAPADSRYCGDGRDVNVLPRVWSGSVDPSWFGCYCDAMVHAGYTIETAVLFKPFAAELKSRGLGHISGAFMGDSPHAALDYMGAACGLAEVLRIYAREVLHLDHLR